MATQEGSIAREMEPLNVQADSGKSRTEERGSLRRQREGLTGVEDRGGVWRDPQEFHEERGRDEESHGSLMRRTRIHVPDQGTASNDGQWWPLLWHCTACSALPRRTSSRTSESTASTTRQLMIPWLLHAAKRRMRLR